MSPLLRLSLFCAGLIPATLHAVNDFSGTGPNQALPFQTTPAQWSLVSGAYQNRVTGINPPTAVVSSAALSHPDALTANTIVLKTEVKLDSFTTPPAAGTPTTGFGLFASTSNFSGTAPQSYYLADFAFADGTTTNNEGRLRILSLGAANSDYTSTVGIADADPATIETALVPGTTYTLILTATRGVSGLSMTLGLYEADGVTQIGTSATALDPTPLTGNFCGYRNRYESGTAAGVYQLTFDNLDITPDPSATPASGVVVASSPVFPGTLPSPATTTGSVLLRNLSTTSPATVSGATLTGPDASFFSVTTPLPVVIPASGTVVLDVLFNPAGQSGYRNATLDLVTNVTPATPSQPLSAVYAVYDTNFLINGAFEDPEPLRGWTARLANSANTRPVAGLRAPSTTAIQLASSNIELVQPVLSGSHWQMEATFAMTSAAFERGFNLIIKNQAPALTAVRCLNFRYDVAQQTFNAFSDQGGINDGWGAPLDLGTIESSTDGNADGDLEDAEDVKNTYRIRLTGYGWGRPGATWDVELTESNSPTFTRKVTGLQRYQGSTGAAAVPTAMGFSTEFGNSVGFWVDDVSFVSTLPSAVPLAITGFSYAPATDLVEFSHTAPLGLAYRIQGTYDFTFWENLGNWLGTGAAQSYNETIPSGTPARFYRLAPR